MKRFAYLLPLIAGACWGCTGIFVRTLDDAGLDNITITFSRVGVMFLMLLLATVVYDRNLLRVKRRDLLLLAVIGVDGLVLMNICYNISITSLSMSLASILLCTAPVFVIIFGSVLYGEKITLLRVACMIGALIGCVLLSGIVESGELKWSVLGLAMGVASSITNAAYAITLKEATDVRKLHPLTIQLYTTLIGMIDADRHDHHDPDDRFRDDRGLCCGISGEGDPVPAGPRSGRVAFAEPVVRSRVSLCGFQCGVDPGLGGGADLGAVVWFICLS